MGIRGFRAGERVSDKFAWISVAGTILLTIYGQLVIKWRLGGLVLPDGFYPKVTALVWKMTDPWIMSALAAAVIASLFWMSAMTRLPLSVAYPFTSLSFIIVSFMGIAFMGEALTMGRMAGVVLVALGLVFIARA